MHVLKETLRRVLDGQVAPAIAEDSAVAGRHFRFLSGQLALGAVGLAAFPLWLALGAPGSVLACIAIVLLLAPLGVVAFVVRSGRIEVGQNIATGVLAALVAVVVLVTGGLSSPAVALFAAVPIAAILGGARSAIPLAAGIAAIAFALMAAFDLLGALGTPSDMTKALTGVVVALVAIGVATLAALRLVGEGRTGAVGKDQRRATAGQTKDKPAAADTGLAAEAGAVTESIASLSGLLADRRVAVAPAEMRQLEHLIKAAGRNAGIAANTEAPVVRVGGRRVPTADLAAAMASALASSDSLARQREVRIHRAGGDWPHVAVPPAECETLVASLIVTALQASSRGSNLLIAFERRRGDVRLSIRSGYAAATPPEAAQPFFQPQSPYTVEAPAAGLGLAEIAARARQLGGNLRLGPRGPGGLIAMLSLPAAEATLGDHRHAEESRNREVRKSA